MNLEIIKSEENFRTPAQYFDYLSEIAAEKGIELVQRSSYWHAVNGSGRTWVEDSRGQRHLFGPVAESEIRKIIIIAHWETSMWHEYTHVRQRLEDPAMIESNLAERELEASLVALRRSHGLGFPLSVFNEVANLCLWGSVKAVQKFGSSVKVK